ncbi:MAG: hypothetical protein A2W90_17940 [Bacteroidetes bacterium GWF2_42_66]|nr:MAG: hypothetical protein A2W92_22200 [Bacteroidetes bacterium GWA2_42_15]OFX98133.1 MAG: hypothetical protein A2W89_09430 [Bacteroidetes bacterium GWE2_42_39]OFY42518.1 MAG: hypothetical protein A2W90_17940 [Bacteroidetes bacterium GWF2_42_66]HBL74234.1 hypothetical protein [Prolixibacteraceae bacterium]HCU64003.1 hypothetical protein [Prolixibacteraceae bacterium]
MEAYTDLYNEIAQRITTKITEIKWVDLWHEQVSFLTDELPFPTPAIFIGFSTNSCEDLAQLIQQCDMQIDLYLFFETFSDTYQGSYNQASAINFLRLLTKLYTAFHGVSGTHFQTMRRVDMRREDSGGAGNLYRITFNCNVEDASAKREYDQTEVNEIVILKGKSPDPAPETEPLFHIPN